jgi:tetratricopeptide (TPR) repeat protein
MRDFLFRLRLRDPVAADRLFASTLNRLTTEPFVDANVLLHLGGYIYTAEGMGPNENSVALVAVGDQLVVDLSLPRPDASLPATLAYLNAATDILLRPISDPQQQKLYYIASFQLYPKIQQLLPSRAPQLAAAMTARANTVPAALAQESTYSQLSSSLREPVVEPREKSSEDKKSDVDYLDEVFSLMERGDYTKAASIAAKIEDLDVSTQLINLSKFYRAIKLIELDVAAAEELAAALDASTEQALLFLGIANKWAELQDTPKALEAVAHALRTIRKQDKSNRGLLLLTAATTLSSLDGFSAREVFSEAFAAFDNQDLELLSQGLESTTVTVDGLPRHFSLTTKRVETNFKQLIKPFVTADCDWTVTAISSAGHEKVLGPAFVAMSETLLR